MEEIEKEINKLYIELAEESHKIQFEWQVGRLTDKEAEKETAKHNGKCEMLGKINNILNKFYAKQTEKQI